MFEKKFCPYCGARLEEHCDCAREMAEYEAELIDDLDERQMDYAYQEDIIWMYRNER